MALVTVLVCAPAFGQSAAPQGDTPPATAIPEPEEKPIGAEAFAEEPAVDLTAARRPHGPSQMTFRVATWHLGAKTAKAAAKADAAQPAEPASTWRHTFGSERRTARWRKLAEAGFAADIVALQGVTSAGDARRLFPARRYHVVVSRQLLARSNARTTGIAVFRNDAPETTAVAYRRQRGVRLAGFRHFLPLALTTIGSEREAAAITAFRLRIHGKLIWVASIDLGGECGADDQGAECRQAGEIIAAFQDWIGQLKDGRAPLVLLGRWPDAVRTYLDNAGFAVSAQAAATRESCTPPPSGALLAVPASATHQDGP